MTNLQQRPSKAADHNLEDAVRNHPFCAGLKASSLHVLLECASLEKYSAQQLVFSEGAEADRFYLVHKGQLALELFVPGSGVVPIQTVQEGEACGTSSLFGTYQWSFSAQTTQACELLSFPASTLREHAERDPNFERELLVRLAPVLFHRLRATRQRLIEFFGSIE
ncbi:MAG: Crp/Fnr family transcriptional regulator [Limisphaerales bacterium]